MKRYKVCYQCDKRYIGCHGKCEEYQREVKESIAEKIAITNYRAKERMLDDRTHTAIVKMQFRGRSK